MNKLEHMEKMLSRTDVDIRAVSKEIEDAGIKKIIESVGNAEMNLALKKDEEVLNAQEIRLNSRRLANKSLSDSLKAHSEETPVKETKK